MRLVIEKGELSRALGHVTSVVERRTTIPILSNVLLKASPNGLEFKATDLEREVMAYAEAMTVTPPEVTDEMVASLDEQLGHAAVVELTMMVAVENERSRFNSAMGLASQGFSDVCDLPLAVPSAT